MGDLVCLFNEAGVTADLPPCLWKRWQVLVADFPSNRATELTNHINITLASDLGASLSLSLSGTAVPVVCLFGTLPPCVQMSPQCQLPSAQKPLNWAQAGTGTNHGARTELLFSHYLNETLFSV